jgi:uroporphyrin-III C-methyltransferase
MGPSDECPGIVYLVGAGPGDPELITVRGLRLLRRADAVLYDSLISPELLEECRSDAERIHVGKRGYCVGSYRQEDINERLVELAWQGKTVCRLKGGDPFVFGRGGEEAEFLAAHGVPFEVVPGVTSALGACAAASIPLTHRDCGQSVTLVTGHFDPDTPACTLDWPALARLRNLVFYMALRHLEKIAVRLIAAGMDSQTPAAVIESATTHAQRLVDGPLFSLPRLARQAEIQAPALIVVGEAVRCRSILSGVVEGALSHSLAASQGVSP